MVGLIAILALTAAGLATLVGLHRALVIEPSAIRVLPAASGRVPDQHALSRFHPRWYTASVVFLAFDVEMLFMYPWAVVVAELGVGAVVEMFTFLGGPAGCRGLGPARGGLPVGLNELVDVAGDPPAPLLPRRGSGRGPGTAGRRARGRRAGLAPVDLACRRRRPRRRREPPAGPGRRRRPAVVTAARPAQPGGGHRSRRRGGRARRGAPPPARRHRPAPGRARALQRRRRRVARGDMDHGDMDHGDMDHGDMEMAPGGIPLAEGAEDRDGLEMDVLVHPLGPLLDRWPGGLELRVTLHGDVVADAEAHWWGAPPSTLTGGTPSPPPCPWPATSAARAPHAGCVRRTTTGSTSTRPRPSGSARGCVG